MYNKPLFFINDYSRCTHIRVKQVEVHSFLEMSGFLFKSLHIINFMRIVGRYMAPGGVLRYISDGDVRSPFLGLKFAI